MDERNWNLNEKIDVGMYGSDKACDYYLAGGCMAINLMATMNVNPMYFHDKDVLDYGCGTGRVSRNFAFLTRSIDGFDVSERIISLANQEIGNYIPKIVKYSTNLDELSKDKKYDIFILVAVLQHVGNGVKDIYQNIKKLAKDENSDVLVWTAQQENVNNFASNYTTHPNKKYNGFYTFKIKDLNI